MSSKIRNTYFIYVLSVVISVVALVSCSTVGEELFLGEEPAQGESDIVEVSLGLPSLSVATRTSIDSDNGDMAGSSLTAKWDKGDSFGLFIRSDEDAAVRFEILDEVLEESGISEPYKFTNDNVHNLQGDIFVGRIPRMPNDADDADPAEYNYYAYYPYDALSVATDRKNEVHCRIPNIQSGRYDDGADIMVAAARGHRLNQQRLNEVDFKFRHLTHALKITIPESKNYFGRNIDRITIEFPQPVAGDAVLDLADITVGADAAPKLNTDGLKYKTIEVRFDEPLSPETDNTFWVFVAPVDLTKQNVVFRAYDDTAGECVMSDKVTSAKFEILEQQHITPVNLSVKQGVRVTWFDYNIVECMERLGEDITRLTLTLPAGYSFADGDGGNTRTIDVFGDNHSFSYALYSEDVEGGLNGQKITTEYESEHAIIKEERYALGITPCTPNIHNYRTEPCPYLFFEDFSTLDRNDDNDGSNKASNDGSKNAQSFLNGWSGARIRFFQNQYFRIACYIKNPKSIFNWSTSYDPARVESAPMSALKNNVSVTLSLTFDYGTNQEGTLSTQSVDQTCQIGKVDSSVALSQLKSDSSEGIYEYSMNSGNDLGLLGTNAGDELIYTESNVLINNCKNTTRISWRTNPTGNINAQNNAIFLYIDNVRVTIVNE